MHLVDGTYELFRSHFGAPPRTTPDGRQVGAVSGFIASLLALLRDPQVTHVACAFDHIIESFRNELFAGYKSGAGVDQELLDQFPLAERASRALGCVTWPMVEFEADDAIATGAATLKGAPGVTQIVLCSPDKDLMQVVETDRVVVLDRRRRLVYDEPAVVQKLGVPPGSVPDYLALVGDTADGIPGVPGWGAKSAGTVLTRYRRLEEIPEDPADWDVTVRSAQRLSGNLEEKRDEVELYRLLATLRYDVPLSEQLQDLQWRGAVRTEFHGLCDELGLDSVPEVPRFR